ncbi:hypothetical protein Tco_0724703, partial [Tanacetum coccineum]
AEKAQLESFVSRNNGLTICDVPKRSYVDPRDDGLTIRDVSIQRDSV